MQQPVCLQIASTAAYSVKTTCVREALTKQSWSLEKEKKEEDESVSSKHVSSKQVEFGMAALYYNPVICEWHIKVYRFLFFGGAKAFTTWV